MNPKDDCLVTAGDGSVQVIQPLGYRAKAVHCEHTAQLENTALLLRAHAAGRAVLSLRAWARAPLGTSSGVRGASAGGGCGGLALSASAQRGAA